MPTFSRRAQAQARDRQGNLTPVAPSVALQRIGPVVQVILMPIEGRSRPMADKEEEPPAPVRGRALIDTGASSTCVDREAATRAGLAVVDSGTMTSATHADEAVPIYAGRISIEGTALIIDANRAYGANLAPQKLVAPIGRDLLSHCVLVYNGTDGSFSLSV